MLSKITLDVIYEVLIQLTFTYSKSTIQTLEKGVKYVQIFTMVRISDSGPGWK